MSKCDKCGQEIISIKRSICAINEQKYGGYKGSTKVWDDDYYNKCEFLIISDKRGWGPAEVKCFRFKKVLKRSKGKSEPCASLNIYKCEIIPCDECEKAAGA